MTLLVAILGAAAAAGVLLTASGLRPSPGPAAATPRASGPTPVPRDRIIRAVAGGLVVLAVNRWPAAAAAAGAAGWFLPELAGGGSDRQRRTERTEAIAAWTEMLRDTLAAAHGLEEAITATAPLAPDPIATEVGTLADRLGRDRLPAALARFADHLDHPTGDLVVAALTIAGTGAAANLADLLGSLAVAARDETGMRLRVEAARARLRTAVRVIASCTIITAGGMVLLNRAYLDTYDAALGQAVLATVAAAWAAGLWWLHRMSAFPAPGRFLTSTERGAGT